MGSKSFVRHLGRIPKSLGPAAINFPRENYTIKQMTQKTIYMPNAYE